MKYALQDALTRAQRDERVRAALGEPVEPGWLVTGHVESSGVSESANLVIPLSGPRGAGTLYLNAARTGGTWRYTVLEVEVKQSGERISLLQDAPAGRGLPPGEALPAEPAPDELPSQPQ
ncbi:MAG: cytochrome c oxidase assembly factor 1 family protein [Bryobacterales bacterium]|nr:cytochrome c oxidase assembly factor 1 family protein [Bryobacterales bacterium]